MKTRIFFRNTVAGHPQCELYKGPVANTKHLRNTLYSSQISHRNSWVHFKRQNEIMRHYFDSLGIFTIDANASTYYRPDHFSSGQDCLHYPIPGPLDTWVIFFWNLLIQTDNVQISSQAALDLKLNSYNPNRRKLGNLDVLTKSELINGDFELDKTDFFMYKPPSGWIWNGHNCRFCNAAIISNNDILWGGGSAPSGQCLSSSVPSLVFF